MDIEPFATCPKCKKLALHYMARVRVDISPRYMNVCEIKEVPRVQWYDEREKLPPTQLKYETTVQVIQELTKWVVRECFYCSHTWDEYWTVDHSEEEIPHGQVWV